MSEQTQSTKKKAAKPKAQKKAKTPKAKPTEKQEELVVFAHRMTLKEREAFHVAAGPARASKVARALAVAFTNEDETAFKALVKEAREARA